MTLVTPHFRRILRGHVRTVPGNLHVKFEVRSFNRFGVISILTPKNLGGHVTLATTLFEKFLSSHVRTVPGNIHVKFEVRSFNRFGFISI